jgi:hypothetical protein
MLYLAKRGTEILIPIEWVAKKILYRRRKVTTEEDFRPWPKVQTRNIVLQKRAGMSKDV